MTEEADWGISVYMDSALKDGQVLMANDFGGFAAPVLMVGTQPWTYAEQFAWDCAVETFGEEFLRRIGAWQPKHEEVLERLRRRRPTVLLVTALVRGWPIPVDINLYSSAQVSRWGSMTLLRIPTPARRPDRLG